MALSETVYSPAYPNNTKTVTVDIQRKIPLGAEGDEKYILSISTTAYSDNTNRTSINPVYMYDLKRGWAESFEVSSPITVSGGTLSLAIDEANSGAITVTLPNGSTAASAIAAHLQTAIRATASGSGAKASATNQLSYLNAQVSYTNNRLRIVSGSVKSSYNDTSDYTNTSSVKVTGGTEKNTLGFTTGYPNSMDLATTASGEIHAPASAVASVDDAVRFGIMTLVNQIDFTS